MAKKQTKKAESIRNNRQQVKIMDLVFDVMEAVVLDEKISAVRFFNEAGPTNFDFLDEEGEMIEKEIEDAGKELQDIKFSDFISAVETNMGILRRAGFDVDLRERDVEILM